MDFKNIPKSEITKDLLDTYGKSIKEGKKFTCRYYITNGRFSLSTITSRFGSWNKSVTYIQNNSTNSTTKTPEKYVEKEIIYKTLNLRLRYKVLLRDKFKCLACGSSPSINPKTILEVDHIKPVSCGGGNSLSNLQTLCFKCNRGKMDEFNDFHVSNEEALKNIEECALWESVLGRKLNIKEK